jgi:DNA mismatch repair protein MutL
VDVNVHPQKVEVRFARPQDVSAAVRHVIARAIAQAPWVQERPPAPVFAVTSQAPPSGERWMASDVANDFALRQEALLSARQILAPLSTASGPAPPSLPERRATGFFGSLRYLGQLDRTFLVCEAPGELVLIDQHAAHERIAFQRLRDAYREQALRSQRLLFPRTVELDVVQAAAAEVNREALLAIGFELEPFGERTWALRTSPVDVREEEVEATLRELLSELGDTDASRAVDERVDLMFATIACHSVVRAGDVLSPAEAMALLSSMDEVDYRAHCPHGRPVLLRMGVTELARRFGRT